MTNGKEKYISILKDLYYGRIRPWAKQIDPDSDYAAAMDRAVEQEQPFVDFLAAHSHAVEGEQWLEEMNRSRDEAHLLGEVDHFMDGFRLGARFMLDTFVLPQQRAIPD